MPGKGSAERRAKDMREAENAVYGQQGKGSNPYPRGTRKYKFYCMFKKEYWIHEARDPGGPAVEEKQEQKDLTGLLEIII